MALRLAVLLACAALAGGAPAASPVPPSALRFSNPRFTSDNAPYLPAAAFASLDAVFTRATATLRGLPLTCGSVDILQGSSYSRPDDLGDAFFRLRSNSSSINRVLAVRPGPRSSSAPGQDGSRSADTPGQAPAGSAVTVPAVETDGVNSFLMQYLQSNGGVRVTCVRPAQPPRPGLTPRRSLQVGKVPPAVLAQGKTAVLLYAFAQWRWDCVVGNVVFTPDKQAAMAFLQPQLQYSLAVVAPRADVPTLTLGGTLSAWSSPFSKGIWSLMAGWFISSAVLMFVFERREHSHEDFGPEFLHWTDRLGRGFYKGVSNWTAIGSWAPLTPSGRVYTAMFSFCVLLLQSAYTANLANFFTRSVVPTQIVTAIDAFPAINASACVLDTNAPGSDPADLGWLQSSYGVTRFQVVPGTITDLLTAVAKGACAGAIASDAVVGYALATSMGDPKGAFCELDFVQAGLSQQSFAIPAPLNASWLTFGNLSAIHSVFSAAMAYGDWSNVADVQFFSLREACTKNEKSRIQALLQLSTLLSLGTRHLASIFFFAALGSVCALSVYACTRSEAARVSWNRLRGLPDEGVLDPDEPPPDPTAGVTLDLSLSRHQQVAVAAMRSIERSLEATAAQFAHVAQTQRELDVLFLLQAGAEPVKVHTVPLAVRAKMDRALAHGLRAVGDVVLSDESGKDLAAVSYGMTTADALAAAHAHMEPADAATMEQVFASFLKQRVSVRRKDSGSHGAPSRARDGEREGSVADSASKPRKGRRIPGFREGE